MPGPERDGWSATPNRLRDLRGRERAFAAALLGIVLVPATLALIRALHDGWIPSGDEANIATRALDVFSRHPPLTGLPSTSAVYGDKIATNHPGPMEFYLLAVPFRLFGATAGPLLTAIAINTGALLVVVWVFLRRLGFLAMMLAGVLALAVMWSTGTPVLSDTLSSNMTTYSLVATAVLAWAVIDGDARVLPLAVVVASYAAQQHLAAGIVVGAVGTFAAAAVVVISVGRRRRGEAVPRWRAPLLTALALGVVCWLPVLIDEVSGHPGNLTAIVRFARDSHRPTVGLSSGFFQAVHAVGPLGTLGSDTATGFTFITSPSALATLLAVAVFALLAAIAWVARRRSPAVARLALVALVLSAAGCINGANVPHSAERARVNLYRWTWAAGFVTWAAIGLAALFLAVHVWQRRRATVAPGPAPAVALLLAAALIATAVAFAPSHLNHNREQPAFRAEKIVNRAVLAHVDRRRPVYVQMYGSDATLSVGPALIFRLVRAGYRVEVGRFSEPAYGHARAYRPKSKPVTITVVSGSAERPSGAGELLAWQPFGAPADARFDALATRRRALIASLTAQARGHAVELTPATARRLNSGAEDLTKLAMKVLVQQLQTDPETSLRSATLLRLVLDGGLRSPALDRHQVRELLELPASSHRGTYGDEQLQVHLIT